VTDARGTPPRRVWKYLLITALIGTLAVAALVWYATTDSFQAMVRRRLVTELEKITGGRVEIGSFHTIPFRLRVEVRNITIHGRESADEVPYAHADSFGAQVKIISVLGAELGFESLLLDHPVIHIIVYPDGSTNQPEPRIREVSNQPPVERLLSLSISQLEVRDGELLWDNQRIPLDFVANDFSASMTYALFRRRYDGHIAVGKVDSRITDFRAFAWHAQADFSLGRRVIEVTSLKLASGASHAEAHGRLADFQQPRIEADYTASLDLADIASIMRRKELRQGVIDIQGKGDWSLAKFYSQGKFQLRDLDWRDENVSLRGARLNSDFWVNDKQLKLSQAQARLFGGTVVGDLEVANWLNPTQPPQQKNAKARKPSDEQKGLLRVRAKGLSVPSVTAAFTTRSLPLDRENLIGTADATIDARWQGSLRDAEAQVALDVTPPARSSSPALPITAKARFSYRIGPQELEVSELSARTPASQLEASGKLSSTSSLRLVVSTNNLDEWLPVITALHGPDELPISLHGRATFSGTASGKFSSLALAGNLQINNFDSTIPASSRTPEREIHWDSFAASVQISPAGFAVHNASLHHSGTDIHFELSGGLERGQLSETTPFLAHVDIHNGDLAEVQSLAEYDYPVSGNINLTLQAAGTKSHPHGEGHVQLLNAKLYGEPVARFTSDLRFVNGEIELNNIQAEYYGGSVSGSAAYNLDAKDYHFNLAGHNFDLHRVQRFQATRFSVEGGMDVTVQGSGTLQEPVVNADIELRDLTFDQERAGDYSIVATTKGSDLHLAGRSHFVESDLSIDGDVSLRNDWPANFTLHFDHLDVDSLIRARFAGRVTGHSAMAGEIQLEGPLRQPGQLKASGNLTGFFIDVENLKLHNQDPILFVVKEQTLTLQQLHLVGDLTDFSAQGTAQLSGKRALDFQANGRVNLKLIETFNPDFTSAGNVAMNLTVSGTASDPIIQGRLQVSDGVLSYADLPSGLSDMRGSLIFNQERMQIETLSAHTGGGTVTLGGFIAYYRSQFSFDLTGHGQDVRLRYPPGVSSTANADVRLVGNTSAASLTGDVLVTKLTITPGFDFGSYLEKSKQSSAIPGTNSLLNNVRMDVHIVTTPDLQMQTALAKLSGDADLRLRGSAERPALLGRVDILEGEVSFNGSKYRLDRGDVTFSNPVRIEPILDLQATTRISDYDITIGLSGTMDSLKPTYRSEPPLPSSDIVALLAMGRTREESASLQGSSGFSQETSNLILSEALNSLVSSRAQRLFGISRIKVDPNGPGTETSIVTSAPQVTIEQQVANNLVLTYSTNVSQTSQQIIQVEYAVTRNVSIVALRDYNGVVSFDVKVRKRKK
jgi:translocation and assembly module TamB